MATKPGRPPKADKARHFVIRMRVTEEERELIKGAALSVDLSVSDWVRPLILEAARTVKDIEEGHATKDDIDQVYFDAASQTKRRLETESLTIKMFENES